MQIRNKQSRFLCTSTGHRLKPGLNKIDCSFKEEAALLSDQQFKNWQQIGWVSVIQERPAFNLAPEPVVESVESVIKPVSEPVIDELLETVTDSSEEENRLQGLNITRSQQQIRRCNDPELLAIWHEKDERKTVKTYIEKRIDELEGE